MDEIMNFSDLNQNISEDDDDDDVEEEQDPHGN